MPEENALTSAGGSIISSVIGAAVSIYQTERTISENRERDQKQRQFQKELEELRSYLTSVLDPERLPPYVVIDLYQKRWRIEDAFNVVKRLLGLSYLWTGSLNGLKLQIWATWLFYAVLALN